MGLQWDTRSSSRSSKWAGYIFHARDFIGSFWEPNTITHRESGLSYFSPIHAYPTAFDGGLSVRAPHSLPRGTTRASMPGAHRGRTSLKKMYTYPEHLVSALGSS